MSARRRQYELARLAEADLEAIYAYTVEQWSLEQATRYLRQIFTTFSGLAVGDRVGRDAELDDSTMKFLIGRHVIYYQPAGKTVLIVRVLHVAMDAPRHLEG